MAVPAAVDLDARGGLVDTSRGAGPGGTTTYLNPLLDLRDDLSARQELAYIGFLSPEDNTHRLNLNTLTSTSNNNTSNTNSLNNSSTSATNLPSYDARLDDEVSARLRTLQHELRRIARLNNVRKMRVRELCARFPIYQD